MTLADLSRFEAHCWRDIAPPELLAIYAPYRRARRVPDRPALLILHPARGISLSMQPRWAIAAASLLQEARMAGVPVLHSLPDGGPREGLLAPRDGEAQFGRPYDDAFMSTDLAPSLLRLRVAGLVMCGATTSGALRATAVEAKAYAFRSAIAEEAVGDEAALLHKVALFDIAHKYADVMSLEQMLGTMRHGRRHGG